MQKIEPTLLDHVTWEDPIMQEEIFGPLLPIVTFQNEAELIHTLQNKESPLALYLFSKNRAFCERVMESVRFGGGCIGDTSDPYYLSRFPLWWSGNEWHGFLSWKEKFRNIQPLSKHLDKVSFQNAVSLSSLSGKRKSTSLFNEVFSVKMIPFCTFFLFFP